MRFRLLALGLLLVLAACTQSATTNTDALNRSNTSIHGSVPAAAANLPVERGAFAVQTQDVDYGPATGFYASAQADEAPGVVLIHEWWGLNENIRETATVLASHGYRVLAVDLYNGSVASTPQDARELVGSVDQQAALANLDAAQQYLRGQGASRVGSWGFCFGGGQSMQLAVSESAPDASVIFYGSPITNASQLSSIRQPVLGVFGAEDSSIPVEQVREFNQSLNSLGVVHEVLVYDGAGHAFANPSGDRFVEDAAADAWVQTLAFFKQHLREE